MDKNFPPKKHKLNLHLYGSNIMILPWKFIHVRCNWKELCMTPLISSVTPPGPDSCEVDFSWWRQTWDGQEGWRKKGRWRTMVMNGDSEWLWMIMNDKWRSIIYHKWWWMIMNDDEESWVMINDHEWWWMTMNYHEWCELWLLFLSSLDISINIPT